MSTPVKAALKKQRLRAVMTKMRKVWNEVMHIYTNFMNSEEDCIQTISENCGEQLDGIELCGLSFHPSSSFCEPVVIEIIVVFEHHQI